MMAIIEVLGIYKSVQGTLEEVEELNLDQVVKKEVHLYPTLPILQSAICLPVSLCSTFKLPGFSDRFGCSWRRQTVYLLQELLHRLSMRCLC